MEIRKINNRLWKFIDSEIGEFSPSKFTINRLNNEITVVYFNNLKSKTYNISDVDIFDIPTAVAFNTSNGDEFMAKLEELNCPCFQKDETIIIGGGSDPLKLDKVTTVGVERTYIINADGSQGTKATSEFKDVLEFANLAAFPLTGESSKIYVALDTNLQYRWGGTDYVQIGGGGSAESDLYSYWFSYTASHVTSAILYTQVANAILATSGTQSLIARVGTNLYNSYHFLNWVSATANGSNAGVKINNNADAPYRAGVEAYIIFGNNSDNVNHVTAVGSYGLLSAVPNLDIANFTTDFVGVGNDPTDTNLSFYCKRNDATASYIKVPTNLNFPAHTLASDVFMLKFETNRVSVQADFQIKLTLTNLINGAVISQTFTGLECPDLNRAFINTVNRSNRNTGVATAIRWIKTHIKSKYF